LVSQVTVSSGAILTIAPGAKVKMQGYLEATGTGSQMRIAGSSNSPVIISSFKDDSVGGDTNSDGSISSPNPGDWVAIYTTNNASLTVDWARISFGGGQNATGMVGSPSISTGNGNVTITNSVIEESATNGIGAWYAADVIIRNSTVQNNSIYGVDVRFSVKLELNNSVIRENALRGVYTDATSVSVNSSQFGETPSDSVLATLPTN
jgi:hypothetical protein